MRRPPFYTVFLTALLVLSSFQPAMAETLLSPFKAVTPANANPKGEIYTCAATPVSRKDVIVSEIYDQLDPTRSVSKPEAMRKYESDVLPLKSFLEEAARMANTYTRSNGRNLSSAKCTLHWLYDWSTQEAMTGEITHQGGFVRKWALASISSIYVQVALDGRLDPKEKVAVKKWIQQLSQIVMTEPENTSDLTRRNHRLSWAAWAVGISSVAIQNKSNYDWAMKNARTGLIQIEDDGTLPLEIRRGARSQTYHLFATEPLVMLAELGLKNGTNLYDYNNGALHRLAAFNIEQLINPAYLAQRSSVPQKIDMKSFSHIMSWLEPYYGRFGFADKKLANKAESILRKQRPLFDMRIGGDATLLFEPESKPQPEQRASIN